MLLLSIVFVPAASAQTNENMGINDECDNFSIEKEYGELFLERMGYSIGLTQLKCRKLDIFINILMA
ncbi:hypothetical protein MSBRM_3435 [Methanosarcina barkeri MS]|uniref:Uncharacterized protein n=4 Tax=Methanosarcina TaxID=2207 RepID=A0A0E3QXP0_METBA|nr:hypothetical protein MSBRM_3435 [Methanosarcina barkeri MS]